MRFKTALVAVLALVLQAQGVLVSPDEAASAVRGWAASGERLDVNFRDRLDLSSGAVETTAVHTASSGAVFYTVKLRDCGTVFVTGDTEMEPVISFTASTKDYSAGGKSPLWTLLDNDISSRKSTDGAPAKWARYWAADPEKRRLLRAAPINDPSDLRVAPLVQSKWGQTTNAAGKAVWNYYAPPGEEGAPDNYPGGCVATMMAQIMRYHHGPVSDGGREVPLPKVDTTTDFTNKYYVGTEEVEVVGKLTGDYDWGNMPLVADEITDGQRQNIGKLMRDCGWAVGMEYRASGSGAYVGTAMNALVDVFGYSQTDWSSPPEPDWSITDEKKCMEDFAEKTASFYQRTLYANFDAGFPCCLSICKVTPADYDIVENVHAVVADGYGFDGEGDAKIPYVHLNMGWDGEENFWYNLPDIGTKFEFNTVDGVGYNIMPVEGGKFGEVWATNSIVSGRVLDDDMNPVAGCTVNIYKSGTLDIVATVKSGANGIWAAILSNGVMEGLDKALYDVEAVTDDMSWYKKVEGVKLGMDNSWGNDLVLEHPSVRVGDRIFSKVDDGIAMARIKAEEGFVGWIPIEILDATWLKRCAQIDFNCVLFATNSAPRESAVTRLFDEDAERHAMLTVADGFSLVMSNVVFAAEKGADTVVTVRSGSSLDIAGTIEFGVSYTNAAVKTADANCFRLLGAIGDNSGFTLSCESATEEGAVLGFCRSTAAEFDEVTNSVSHIANYADDDGEIRAKVANLGTTVPPDPAYNYKLVWRKQQVPVEDAVAYFEDKDGKMTTAGSINALLGKYEEALQHDQLPPSGERAIHIQKDGMLSRPLAIGYGLSIVGDDVEVLVEESAGFTVAAGGNLSVSGISFSGYKGNALFLVNGGGASLDMAEVSFSNIEGTNKWSGAVTILKGSARIDDSIFTGCRATGTYVVRNNVTKTRDSYGGAIYVASGASLDLRNSIIMDCNALTKGGAIYAETDAVVSLGGGLWISQNTRGKLSDVAGLVEDDVFLKNTSSEMATLKLVDIVTGRVGVCWYKNASGYGNTNGCRFAVAESAEMAEGSVDAFFNDLDSSLVARADGVALRWSEPPEGPQPLPQTSPGEVPEGAIAGVVSESGDVTKYYASVADAITVAKDGETVVVLVDATFSSDISVSANIALTSDGHTLTRTGDCSISIGSEASLTIGDIEIVGGSVETTTKRPLFDVHGGSLTLASGGKICDVNGDEARNAGAVSVWQGGRFTMESGAEISNCVNRYDNEADGAGRGGALLVDSGEAVFTGGTVTGCMARNGGVFIGNGAVVKVSGDTVIAGNLNLQWKAKDLVVYDLSADKGYLLLDGELTGSIGYTEGVSGNTNVFGSVSDNVSDEDALASAHRFTHDVTGDIGKAVKNGDSRILVWSAALDGGGNYIDVETGDVYQLVDGEPAKIEFPTKKENLVYNGNLRTGVVESAGFTLVGNVATNAGLYTANATLRPGYVWEDGSSDPTDVQWSIAKAKYDMRYVSFPNRTFSYDGDWHAMAIEGALPDGVEVSYSENYRQRDVGVYDVVAYFTGDSENYEPIDDRNATLTIENGDEPTPPGDDPPEPTPPATPVPIDFSALASSDGTKWIISVTDAVAKCWYSLYETDSLVGGFKIDGMDPISRRRASDDDVPKMVFERPRTGEQLFWRVKAESEDMYTYPDDEY